MNNGVRQISGKWRIPGLVDMVPGDLHIDDGQRSIILSFCASLGMAEAKKVFPDRLKLSVICGESVDGIPYVLGDCCVNVPRFTVDAKGARAYGRVIVMYAFEGLRLPLTDSSVEFTRASVDFGEIVVWARLCNFDSAKEESMHPVYSWNSIVSQEFPIERGRYVSFSAKATFVGCPGWSRKLTLTQGVNADFCYPQLTSFVIMASDIRRMREIISFAIGRRMAPVTAEVEVVPYRSSDGTGISENRKCKSKVFFGDGIVPDVSEPDVFGYIFTLPELARVARTSENWGLQFDKFQPALELFLSPMVSDEKMVRAQFLAVMQGVELLHTISTGDSALAVLSGLALKYNRDGSDFETDKRALFGDYRFTDKTRVSLKLRLFDLLYHSGDWPIPYPFGMSFLEFLRKLKDSRDYYTHYKPEEAQKAFAEDELPEINWFLQSIFRYHMLMNLGFAEDVAYSRMVYGIRGFHGPANVEEWNDS